jgi:methylenetetrahydrofolate dehydrogenase (NADP+)/methenyltetrahydrofolate cyclohydrolase
MSRARLIDGKAAAARLRANVATRGRKPDFSQHGLQPGLAVVIVGDDPASHVYVRNKARQTVEVGMHSVEIRLPATTSQDELLATVARLNSDASVHGILVAAAAAEADRRILPLIAAIDPVKDVDGFHPVNAGLLATPRRRGSCRCTPLGCLILLKSELGDLAGRSAVVVGRSNIVGKPMAQLLLRESCTVTIAHSRTRDLPAECRRADILVAAVGRPRMIGGDWVKPGATVIDVGINRISEPVADGTKERLVGDVDFDSAVEVAGAITPMPGERRPMTIACPVARTR